MQATFGRTKSRSNAQEILPSASRPISAWRMMLITTRKDLQIQKRYIPNLVGKMVELGIRVMFFLLLSNVITVNGEELVGRSLAGRDLFIFFQGSLLLFVFNGIALKAPINAVSRDLYNGTLEFLYSNPPSRYAYYVGTVLAEAIVSQAVFLPLYAVLVFATAANFFNMFMVLLVCAVMLVTLVAFGVLIALLGLMWRQVNSVVEVLAIAFEMLAGAYFPVTAFPEIIQYIAYALPYTWGYDLVRYYSFGGEWRPIAPIWAEWTILIGFAVLYTLLSRFLLKRVEQKAKQNGLHLI